MFFIIVIILGLGIGQLFFLRYQPYDDLHLAFAQSTNATSIMVPSNMNRMEITLTNSDSGKNSQFDNLIIAGIAVGGALGGSLLGSYMTYWTGRKRAQWKINEEEKKEKIRLSKLRQMIVFNITLFGFAFKDLADKDWKDYNLDNIRTNLEKLKNEYHNLPVETRLSIFTPEITFVVSLFFHLSEALRDRVINILDNCKSYPKEDQVPRARNEIQNIFDTESQMSTDEIIEMIKEEYPEDIEDLPKIKWR